MGPLSLDLNLWAGDAAQTTQKTRRGGRNIHTPVGRLVYNPPPHSTGAKTMSITEHERAANRMNALAQTLVELSDQMQALKETQQAVGLEL